MNSVLVWDDLRFILAVADAGTLSGAGRQLSVSHATVFRRLNAVEERLGVRLFERSNSGYSPTVAGSEVVATAKRIALEVIQVERRLTGQDHQPRGTVRITTTDTLLTSLLSPILYRFCKANPFISIEIAISNQVLNLSRREADVALRPSDTPQESLVGRKVGKIEQAVYSKRDQFDDIDDSPWIGPDEEMHYSVLNKWMATNGFDLRCSYRINTGLGMMAAVIDGVGVAAIPCYLGDSDDRLVRIGNRVPELATDLWLLTHSDLRKTVRIRILLDFIAEAIRAEHPRLGGNV